MNLSALLLFFLSHDPLAGGADATPPADSAPTSATIAGAQEQASLWERLKLSAYGRLRGESTFDQPNGEDRHRGRLRFRLQAEYELLETLRAEARLSTVSDGRDANNPHWDFGDGADGFAASEVGLDRFYVDWTALEGLSLRGGKLPHAFVRPPVFGELVWDEDVHPAGLTALWKPASEGDVSFDLRLAEYVAVEDGSDVDPSMFGAQGNLYVAAGEKTRFQLSASYSDWSNLDAMTPGNQGNTDPAGEFAIVEGILSGTYDGGPLDRTTGYVQLLNNVDDDDDEDSGYSVGAQCGKSGSKGATNVFAAWYDLDANAVYSAVAQDDTPIAGTGIGMGMQGAVFGAQYFVTDQVSLKLWALTSDADAAEDPFRIRLDLDFTVR